MMSAIEINADSEVDIAAVMSQGRDRVVLADFTALDPDETVRAFHRTCSQLGELRDQTGAHDFVRVIENRSSSMPSELLRYSDTATGGDFHTDGPTVEGNLPAYVGLLCMSAPRIGGETVLIDGQRVFRSLSDRSRDRLQRTYAFDPRLGSAGRPILRQVLIVDGAHVARFCYLRSYLEAAQYLPQAQRLSSLDIEAFDELDRELERPNVQEEVSLTPGVGIFFANDRYLHGRRQFADWSEETGLPPRRLLRAWMGHQPTWSEEEAPL
jgi:alpha-ketoglutarate-dependent taurine dioxygenase